MSEDHVSAGEVLAALEKMDKVFKSFESTKKVVEYLAGLEQNVRELKAQVAGYQESAAQAKVDYEDALCRMDASQALRVVELDKEFAEKRAQLEASCKSYQASIDDAVEASRGQHRQILVQIADGEAVLEEQRRTEAELRDRVLTLESRMAAARESVAKILEGKL